MSNTKPPAAVHSTRIGNLIARERYKYARSQCYESDMPIQAQFYRGRKGVFINSLMQLQMLLACAELQCVLLSPNTALLGVVPS